MSKPETLFSKLYRRQKGLCYICNKHMKKEYGHSNSATIDHVVPKSMYGRVFVDKQNNKKLACYSCNQGKADKGLHQYLKEVTQ